MQEVLDGSSKTLYTSNWCYKGLENMYNLNALEIGEGSTVMQCKPEFG